MRVKSDENLKFKYDRNSVPPETKIYSGSEVIGKCIQSDKKEKFTAVYRDRGYINCGIRKAGSVIIND